MFAIHSETRALAATPPPPSSPPLVPVQIGLVVFRRKALSTWLTESICCARGPGRSLASSCVVVRLALNRPGSGDVDLEVPPRTPCPRADDGHSAPTFLEHWSTPRAAALGRAGRCASMYVIAVMHA